MKLPVILIGDGSLDLFTSLVDAERSMEPIDVSAQLYSAFDADGQVLNVFVERHERSLGRLSRLLHVEPSIEVCRVSQSGEWQPDRLREELRSWIHRTGMNEQFVEAGVNADVADIPQLLDLLKDY